MSPAESSEEWNYILDGDLGYSHVTECGLIFPLVVVLILAPISGNNVGNSNTEKSVEAIAILSTVSPWCLQLGNLIPQVLQILACAHVALLVGSAGKDWVHFYWKCGYNYKPFYSHPAAAD